LSHTETFSQVLTTNFYSPTHAGYPFINHHWGSGIIFYLHVYFIFGLGVLGKPCRPKEAKIIIKEYSIKKGA